MSVTLRYTLAEPLAIEACTSETVTLKNPTNETLYAYLSSETERRRLLAFAALLAAARAADRVCEEHARHSPITMSQHELVDYIDVLDEQFPGWRGWQP